MIKEIKKKVWCVLMSLFVLVGCFNQVDCVEAATGLNMVGTTLQGYCYTNSNFPIYNKTSAGKKQIGTCYGKSDLIKINAIGTDGWSSITIPTAKGYKTGYCKTSFVLVDDEWNSMRGVAQYQITAYKKSNCSTSFGYVSAKDYIYIFGYANGNTQVLYPVNAGWKIGWLKGTFIIRNHKLVDTAVPVISNVRVSNISSAGYTVTCTVKDNVGVTQVKMPTWTSKNGQDDLVWHVATVNGSTATFTIKRENHKNETGAYNTDIYAYDKDGNYNCFCKRNIIVPNVGENNNIVNTSMAEKIVEVAKSQVGQKERSAGSDDVKYNDWYYNRRVYNSYSGQYAWCAVFVSWCANSSGISTGIIPKTANVENMKATLVKNGATLHLKGTGYNPVKGDIILFTNGSRLNHVGIVDYTSGGKVYYIDGNNTGTTPHGVHYSNCSVSASKVYGYVTPRYN